MSSYPLLPAISCAVQHPIEGNEPAAQAEPETDENCRKGSSPVGQQGGGNGDVRGGAYEVGPDPCAQLEPEHQGTDRRLHSQHGLADLSLILRKRYADDIGVTKEDQRRDHGEKAASQPQRMSRDEQCGDRDDPAGRRAA